MTIFKKQESQGEDVLQEEIFINGCQVEIINDLDTDEDGESDE